MRRNATPRSSPPSGPATSTPELIRALFEAGVDVFRLNFSHGTPRGSRGSAIEAIRAVEARAGRPIGILMDLQGPKLRVGTFADGPVELARGAAASGSTSTRRRATSKRVCCRIPRSSPC